jgi:hypothetical protein
MSQDFRQTLYHSFFGEMGGFRGDGFLNCIALLLEWATLA